MGILRVATLTTGLVRVSKFSSASQIRATALYWETDPAVAVRLVIGRDLKRAPLRRTIRARNIIGAPSALRAPPVVDHGWGPGYSYLVEHLVFGHHPRTPTQKHQVGNEVIDSLIGVHSTGRLRHRRGLAHPETPQRIRGLFEQQPAAEGSLSAPELIDAAAELVDTRCRVPTGWTHGDVVFSNLICDPQGVVHLIDWEQAGIRPVIADLGKIAAAIPGTAGLVRVLEAGAGSPLENPHRGLPVRQQLTRYFLQEISWWEPKYRRAQETDRMRTFDAWVRRRLEVLSFLLSQS